MHSSTLNPTVSVCLISKKIIKNNFFPVEYLFNNKQKQCWHIYTWTNAKKWFYLCLLVSVRNKQHTSWCLRWWLLSLLNNADDTQNSTVLFHRRILSRAFPVIVSICHEHYVWFYEFLIYLSQKVKLFKFSLLMKTWEKCITRKWNQFSYIHVLISNSQFCIDFHEKSLSQIYLT